MADERLFDNWFNPVETAMHTKVRDFMETMIEAELKTALSRPGYERWSAPSAEDHPDELIVGHRHGHRVRSSSARQIGHVHPVLTSDLREGRRLGSGTRHFLKRGQANWRGRLPRYEEHSLCHRSAYTIDLFLLTQQSLPK